MLAWRLRFAGASILGAFVVTGESVGLLFSAALAVAFLVLTAGSAMARIEARVHALHRQERRR